MAATLGKPNSGGVRWNLGLALALLWVIAIGPFNTMSAQTSQEKYQAQRGNSPFNLSSSPNGLLQANLVTCGINNIGEICKNVFDSPTGGGGYWPSGTTNQYIFNAGLQVAGINSAAAGPWARDTVAAFFFDARGANKHGEQLSDVFSSLDPSDLANWPEGAFITDTSIYNAALLGSKSISDQDSYVEYWDGSPNKLSGRSHPMGIRVEQRSLAFNAPAGAENTLFFIFKFTNVTNDPTFISANNSTLKVNLPAAGWQIDSIYAAWAIDADVSANGAGTNFSTAFLPLNMGFAYHASFDTPEFNFAARADLYAAPFFPGPGLVGIKYLRSPVNPVTKQQVGLTMFSNTTNPSGSNAIFPDPATDKQLFRYLKGDPQPSAGDPVCNIPNAIQRRVCAIVQGAADTRFFQASGPFSLKPGESATIVVAATHGAPVRVAGYSAGTTLPPGFPARTPGVGTDTLNTIDRIAGMIRVSPAAVSTDAQGNTFIDQKKLVAGTDFVRRSLIHNALIAQSIFDNKFLLPRPPDQPIFSLVPGDEQVTVVWSPSATDVNCVEGRGTAGAPGDPYALIALDPTSPLFNPNYRRCDVEGYRIYRATGLSGGFELIAQFDKIGSVFLDVTCELNPDFVPEEGEDCEEHAIELVGDIVEFREGGRVRNAVTGTVVLLPAGADTVRLQDTGVPFAFVDHSVRNGITYRYIVTAFDVNSLKSGSASLESARVPQFVTPRKDPNNLVFASFESGVSTAVGTPLPTFADPTISSAAGTFSGPQPPTNGLDATFAPLVPRLLPAFNLKASIDSIKPATEATGGGCPKGSNAVGACWKIYMTFDRDGTKTSSVSSGYSPVWVGFDDPTHLVFPMGAGAVPPDATAAAQFGLPSTFPGFVANVVGTFPETIIYSQMEGQTNRRAITGSTIYPGFGTGARHVAGGSRWFSGANETVADPTRLIRVGHLDAVDSVWAPIHHSPTIPDDPGALAATGATSSYPASGQMQCWTYFYAALGRAADVKFTWGASGALAATDISHNTPVIFKPNVQASWGLLTTDANGNGVIDWADFNYVSNASEDLGVWGPQVLSCGHTDDPAKRIALKQTLTAGDLKPVSLEGTTAATAKTASGVGFGLYVNGERYIFQLCKGAGCTATVPASGTAWTLRTYTGILRAGSNASALSADPSGYSFRGDVEPRQPMVTGIAFNATSSAATGQVGEVDITKIHTVPDPYYVRSAFELGPSNKSLRFVNLPTQAVIRIYSLNGTLVRVIEHNDPQVGAEASWDLRNRNQQFVASGVYFYVVEAADGKKFTGKLTVVQFAR